MNELLRRLSPDEVKALPRQPVDEETLAGAREIVFDVRDRGEPALREHAERLGDLRPGESLIRNQQDMVAAFEGLSQEDRDVLTRTADRIREFAETQKQCLESMTCSFPGGQGGHHIDPVQRAGCYAPGGRFPLPSTVLMTAVTARVAGVDDIWLASPRPSPVTLAAAAVAGADGLLAVGGAQAISALAYGVDAVPACDVIVGPGNRWVTAAKQWVVGRVGIDMLAGPSELVVLADATADPGVVASDLLAQAEHDPDALPVLVTPDEALLDAVREQARTQLTTLSTAETARAALEQGFGVVTGDMDTAVEICDLLAPEHLEVQTADAKNVAGRLRHYGALFIGSGAAEVLGDYGAGPNHVLPTGGTARFTGGLSVLTFLRVRTWMSMDEGGGSAGDRVIRDAIHLARLEGLEGHARSAERRLK